MSNKCVFNQAWLEDEAYKDWVKPVEDNKFSFECRLCKKTRALGNMGKNALRSHAESQRHKQLMKLETSSKVIENS